MSLDEKQIASKLLEMGKIRVYLFRSPTSKPDFLKPEEALSFVFSEAGYYPDLTSPAFQDFSSDQFVLDFLSEFDNELSVEKIGIQATNYSVSRFLDYARFQERFAAVQQKLTAKQTLSKEETLLQSGFLGAFETYPESKLKKAIYFRSLYLTMMDWACRLAVSTQGQKQVSICPDDTHRNISAKCSIFELGNYSGMQFTLDNEITQLLRKHNIRDYIVYCESELKKTMPPPCECVFCQKMRCPSLVSEAIERLESIGCNLVVNFYPEYDGFELKGCSGSTVPHFERVERGTLHKLVTLNANIRICNVFTGNQTFAIMHEPFSEKEKKEVLAIE